MVLPYTDPCFLPLVSPVTIQILKGFLRGNFSLAEIARAPHGLGACGAAPKHSPGCDWAAAPGSVANSRVRKESKVPRQTGQIIRSMFSFVCFLPKEEKWDNNSFYVMSTLHRWHITDNFQKISNVQMHIHIFADCSSVVDGSSDIWAHFKACSKPSFCLFCLLFFILIESCRFLFFLLALRLQYLSALGKWKQYMCKEIHEPYWSPTSFPQFLGMMTKLWQNQMAIYNCLLRASLPQSCHE